MIDAASLVAKLAEAGTPPELLAAVAKELFAGESAREVVEARRKKDRERKPRKSEEIQGSPRKSRNGVEIRDTLSPLSPPKKDPGPQKITPPISPKPEDSSVGTDPPLTADEVVEAWNDRMVPQGFPAVKRLTGQRQRLLSARLRENTLEDWRQAMTALEQSKFCRGENNRGWRADFDFLLQPKSFTKLLEGSFQ